MKTLLFCTSFILDKGIWEHRYKRWLAHHQASPLVCDGIVLIDDGSPYIPTDIPVVSAQDIGRVALTTPTLVRFEVNLGRASMRVFPGWGRSFGFAMTIAEKYGFDKIVHIESDALVLTERITGYINGLSAGWTAFWVPSQRFPESALQVVCSDSFAAFAAVRDLGPYGNKDRAPELALPFTLVNKEFVGDRYGEIGVQIPKDADYAVQVLPTMPTKKWPATQHSVTANAPTAATPTRSVVRADATDVDRADALRDCGDYTGASRLLAELQQAAPLDMTVVTRQGIVAYLQGEIPSARLFLEKSVANEPGDPHAQKFLAAARMDDWELTGAIAAALEAVRLSPKDANLRTMLAAFLRQAERFADAVPHLLTALEIDPNDGSILSSLAAIPWQRADLALQYPGGMLAMEARARELLLQCLKDGRLTSDGAATLIALRASNAQAFAQVLGLAHDIAATADVDASLAFGLGKVFGIGGDAKAALAAFAKAHALDPASFRIRNALGYQQIFEGGSGWAEGFATANQTWPLIHPDAYVHTVASWRGEPLDGEELFVYQEQGIGDALMALRFVPMLAKRGIRVALWTSPSLEQLATSVGGARFVRSATRPEPAALGLRHAVSLFGVIDALGLGASDVKEDPTRVSANPERSNEFSQLLGSHVALRVGLCLMGNPDRGDDWVRTVPSDQWRPLSQLMGIDWVNLSVDQRSEQDLLVQRFSGIRDFRDRIQSFDDTAALMANLDVVVSIDSVVAHIAAALGKPTLLLLPSVVDWRWQCGDDMQPWWPTTEAFRASAPQNFGAALEAVAQRLEALRQLHPDGPKA